MKKLVYLFIIFNIMKNSLILTECIVCASHRWLINYINGTSFIITKTRPLTSLASPPMKTV